MNHSLRKALALLMALLIAMPTFAFAEGPADGTVVLDDSIEIIDEEQQVSSDAIEPPAEEAEALLLDDIASEYSDDAAGSETAAPEEASALVERVVSVDGVTFRVTSAAGAFPEDAALRVTPWEDAGIVEAVEAAFGAEGVYTHRQYRLELLDSAENVILPSLEQGVPAVRVEGLDLSAEARVAVYDEGMQGVYEIGAKVLSEDNAMLFDFVDAAVYDIFSGEEETVEEEPAGDEPAEESEEQEAEDVQPVEVVFDAMPDTAAVTVRPADAEEAVPAQADGSYLLLPGEYTYSAVADGFVSIEDVPFTVTGDEQPLRLSFALEPDIAEEYDAGVGTAYIQRSWDGEKVVEETKYTSEQAQSVPADGQMTSGFYYLDRDVTVDGRIELTGDTWLILGDGFTLDVKGLYIPEGSKLTIYGQGEEKGKLYSHPNGGGAAIGGYSGHDNGTIVIMGGTIVAEGDGNCAAIGSNDSRATGDITIFGGTITATGGDNGAGIGGGNGGAGGTINVYGGTVRNLISDTGSKAAGIGGGANGDGGTVTVYGGTVIAHRDTEGAAIGGGVGSSDDGKLYVATTHAVYSDESNIDLEHTDNVAYKQQGKGVNTELDITRQQNMTIVEGLVTYPIWVGGTQVTSANATNITGEETVTASYDADNHTLTLNGATISGGSYKNAAIYAEGMNLTIDVKGDSTVTGPANSTSYGIYLHPGSLTITGVGTLTAAGGTGSDSTGIRTHKYNPSDTCNVTIAADTSLTAIGNGTSYSDGVNAEGVVTVNGTLTAISGTCSNSRGINVNAMSGNYTVIINENGKLTASGNKAIVGTVKNAVAGTSWTNVEGTEGAALIEVSADEGQTLSQDNKKVQFPKSKATVTTAPVAAALIYNGEAQALVTAGEATGGEMRYAYVTDADAEPDESAYSADIPTAIETGIYYVWYKAVGDGPHIDSEPGYVTVEIVSTDASGSATAQTLPYTAQPQPLVKGGEVVGGYLEYVLGGDDVTAPAEGWSTEVPTGTDPGTYYVWYKVVPDKNHNPYGPKCVVVTIEPPVVKPTEEPTPDVPEEVKPEPEQVSDYTLFATMKSLCCFPGVRPP